jgi:hypothetical protein
MFPFPEEPLPQDDFGEITDLLALCGRQYHEDDEGIDPSAAQQDDLKARLDIVMPDYSLSRIVTSCVPLASFATHYPLWYAPNAR